MGDRAFLLHYRTDAGSVGALVAIGVASPTAFAAPARTEQCARIVLLVAAPPRMAARYLQVVGGFARLLRTAGAVRARCSPRPMPRRLVDARRVRRVSASGAAHRARRDDRPSAHRARRHAAEGSGADARAHRARRAARRRRRAARARHGERARADAAPAHHAGLLGAGRARHRRRRTPCAHACAT